jgi:hypothetical protein
MAYLDKLEDEVQRLREREKLWLLLAQSYSYMVRKFQLGKTVNRENYDDVQKYKNQLGIGNGIQ